MEINKKMLIGEILEVNPKIANVLLASGMHCIGCMMASGETLEQACAVHGIDCDEHVERINAMLAE